VPAVKPKSVQVDLALSSLDVEATEPEEDVEGAVTAAASTLQVPQTLLIPKKPTKSTDAAILLLVLKKMYLKRVSDFEPFLSSLTSLYSHASLLPLFDVILAVPHSFLSG